MNKEIDVRHILSAVRVPTIILHGSEDTIVPVEVARYVASQIPTARGVDVPGVGHLAFGIGAERIGDEIERFLAEVWEAGSWEEGEPDRVLATILFTDIVVSTARAAELADRAWRELLAEQWLLFAAMLLGGLGISGLAYAGWPNRRDVVPLAEFSSRLRSTGLSDSRVASHAVRRLLSTKRGSHDAIRYRE